VNLIMEIIIGNPYMKQIKKNKQEKTAVINVVDTVIMRQSVMLKNTLMVVIYNHNKTITVVFIPTIKSLY